MTFVVDNYILYTHTKYVMTVCKNNNDDQTLNYFIITYVCTYECIRSSSEFIVYLQEVDDDSGLYI